MRGAMSLLRTSARHARHGCGDRHEGDASTKRLDRLHDKDILSDAGSRGPGRARFSAWRVPLKLSTGADGTRRAACWLSGKRPWAASQRERAARSQARAVAALRSWAAKRRRDSPVVGPRRLFARRSESTGEPGVDATAVCGLGSSCSTSAESSHVPSDAWRSASVKTKCSPCWFFYLRLARRHRSFGATARTATASRCAIRRDSGRS